MMEDFRWDKIRHENGYWQYFAYSPHGEKVGSVIPYYVGKKKKWKCQFLDHAPFNRDSLKYGKNDVKFLYEQFSSNNLAKIEIGHE
tara:strand:- start:295 stop:552 length:258 start_codon:yes stop_codon:yes gene_type:complete